MKLTKLLLGALLACGVASAVYAQSTTGAIEQLPIRTLSHIVGHDGTGRVGREPVTDFIKPGTTSPIADNLVCWGTTANLIADCGKSLPSGAVVGTTDAQTLPNKTLPSPVITGGANFNGSTSGTTVLQASPTASGTLTLPAATGPLVAGPTSTNSGDLACWTNATGSQLTGCRQFVSVLSFKNSDNSQVACNGTQDDTTGIQAAETYAASVGAQLNFPSSTCIASVLVKQSNSAWVGQGYGTVLKQKAGTNSDFIIGPNNNLYGTNTVGGITNFAISNLRIDGNSASNSSGDCLSIYGYLGRFKSLWINNCAQRGFRTEASLNTPTPLESYYEDVYIQNTGREGRYDNGPHDSITRGMFVLNACQATNNTYDAFYFGPQTTGQLVNTHSYGPGGAPGVNINCRYAINDSSAGIRVSNSFFEQGVSAILNAASNGISSYDSGVVFANALGGPTIIISQPVILNGLAIQYFPGTFSAKGVVFAAGNPSGSTINLKVYNMLTGAIDFTNSTGNNTVNINGFTSSGPGYVGSPLVSDSVQLNIQGATSAGTIAQVANGTLGTAATNTLLLPTSNFATGSNNTSLAPYAYRKSSGSDWTTASICQGVNVDASRAVNDAQICFNPNNGGVGIGSAALAAATTYKMGVYGTLGVVSSGANASRLSIDNAAGGNQSLLSLLDAGTSKWQLGKQTDNSFFIYDSTAGSNIFSVASGGPAVLTGATGTVIGSPTGGGKGAGTINTQGVYYANGTAGVSCAAGTVSTSTMVVTNGIVTHC